MTRLKSQWIEHMREGMSRYNAELAGKIGLDLGGLAMEMSGLKPKEYEKRKHSSEIAVVSITQGMGIIENFAESVCAILRSAGFSAYTLRETDVEGIYQSLSKGKKILFMADDLRYLAFNLNNGKFSDNNQATAWGFVKVMEKFLEKKGRSYSDSSVLLIGCGKVGSIAAELLDRMGVEFSVYDKEREKMEETGKWKSCRGKLSNAEEIVNYDCILDFTNEGNWIDSSMIASEALYVSPGVPLSLTEEVKTALRGRMVFDHLEIGTAIMIGTVL